MASHQPVSQPSSSNDVLKWVFRSMHEDLVSHIEVLPVLDYLYGKRVISHEMITTLMSVQQKSHNPSDAPRQLLLLLYRSLNPSAFVEMYKALQRQPTHKWLIEKIDEACKKVNDKTKPISLGIHAARSATIKDENEVMQAYDTFKAIEKLHDKLSQYSDLLVMVGKEKFPCHKLILILKSPYFQKKLQKQKVQIITINQLTAASFKAVLRYFYTGEIDLNPNTVNGVAQAAKLFELDTLKKKCQQLMEDTLDVMSCVQYWKNANGLYGDSNKFMRRCLDLFAKHFREVCKPSRLSDVPLRMLKNAITRDDLNIGNEQEVCDVLLKWLHQKQLHQKKPLAINVDDLLSDIRWSGVDLSYILDMKKNNAISKSDYLANVIGYKTSQVQFPNLNTHHRSSTKLEMSIMICGGDDGNKTISLYRIGLQSKHIVALDNIPTYMNRDVTGCTNGEFMYVSGLGRTFTETLAYGSNGGWTMCANMAKGRHSHCATFVNSTSMYALGGTGMPTNEVLSSVELFNTTGNRWRTDGELAECVHSAGCAAYNNSIYVFGGIGGVGQSTGLNCIQIYDTVTHQCTKLQQSLPSAQSPRPNSYSASLRVVPWNKSAILMNRDTCMIFDFQSKRIQQRNVFAAGVQRFGLVIDNGTLFVLGGGRDELKGGKEVWTTTDVVKSIPVIDIVENKQKDKHWSTFAHLNSCSYVYACALMISSTDTTPITAVVHNA